MPKVAPDILPSFTSFQLLNAAYGSLVACLVASGQFLPWFGDRFSIQLFALSTAWALAYTSLDYSFAVDFAWKTYIGACMGAALGAILVYVTAPLNGGVYSPMWASLFGLPFCFILAMGCQGKASEAYSYTSALLRMYSILAFGEGEPYNKALFIIVVGFCSDMVPMLVVSVLNCFGMLPLKALPPLPRFEQALKSYLELSVFYLVDARKHKRYLDRKRDDLVEAFRAVLKANVPKPLKLDASNVVGLLHGFHASATTRAFGRQAIEHFWAPLRGDIGKLASLMGMVLTEPFDEELTRRLRDSSERLLRQVRVSTVEYGRKVADAKCPLFSTRELARIELALLIVPRCSLIVADYVEKKHVQELVCRGHVACTFPIPTFLRDFKAWIRKPWYPASLSRWERVRYPLRFTICLQAVVWLAVGLASRFEIVAAEGWWIIVPAILCSFDAFGLTVSKGGRRILGIFLGGVLALIPLAIHPGQRAPFLLELFIVGAISKLVTDLPSIDYTGLQTGVTFIIVGFADGINPEESEAKRYLLAGLRLLCNSGGLILFMLMTLLTRPPYSGELLAKATSREIDSISGYVTSIVRALRGRPDVAFPDRVEKGLTLIDLDGARIAKIPSVRAEARALRVIGISTTRCGVGSARLVAAQASVPGLLHGVAMVYTELSNCDLKMGVAAGKLLLEPVQSLLEDFEDSLTLAAIEINKALTSNAGSGQAIAATREALDAYLRLDAAFQSVRADLLYRRTWATSGDVMASTKLAEVVSGGGGVSLHVALYSLGFFVEEWVQFASLLLGADIRFPNEPSADDSTDTSPCDRQSTITTLSRCLSEGQGIVHRKVSAR
ncbi:hypothetical protein FOL47_010446 [Perkinsus chesapeaki]|uniref:Integral membrane bound transporter domain-containing protein n=1 Tax=Perkinsus chesapeaki TaxID=330153 RepID=A0A7J6MPK6_PERCH|nr:hypothetical protein FOL47_010446 [Perkinsus chesapeaki]